MSRAACSQPTSAHLVAHGRQGSTHASGPGVSLMNIFVGIDQGEASRRHPVTAGHSKRFSRSGASNSADTPSSVARAPSGGTTGGWPRADKREHGNALVVLRAEWFHPGRTSQGHPAARLEHVLHGLQAHNVVASLPWTAASSLRKPTVASGQGVGAETLPLLLPFPSVGMPTSRPSDDMSAHEPLGAPAPRTQAAGCRSLGRAAALCRETAAS